MNATNIAFLSKVLFAKFTENLLQRKMVKLAENLLQQKMVKLAEKLLQQKMVKFCAAVKNGQVCRKFAGAKKGQVSRKFTAAKIGQVSRKFAAAKLFVANSFRFSLVVRAIENDDDNRKENFSIPPMTRVMDPNFPNAEIK